VARDSGVTVVARREGVVESVDAARIVVRTTSESDDLASAKPGHLQPGEVPAIQPEHVHQPASHRRAGDHVKPGDVIADGPATEKGELALGETSWSRSCLGWLQLRGLHPHFRAS